MGNVKSDESRIRGRDLGGADSKGSVDHVDYKQNRNPDAELRDNEGEDTLYDDGLELEDDLKPLTGVNGDDDSVRRN
jgi:hypothetical protein